MTSSIGMKLPKQVKNKGFTFVELLLVVLLIGIIISVSTPRFRRTFDSLRLENFSLNLAQLIKYSRERAIAEGKRHRLIFEGRQYSLQVEKDSLDARGEFTPLKSRWGRKQFVPGGITLETETAYIDFYPSGQISEATLYLSGAGEIYTLIIERILGRVRVFDYRKE